MITFVDNVASRYAQTLISMVNTVDAKLTDLITEDLELIYSLKKADTLDSFLQGVSTQGRKLALLQEYIFPSLQSEDIKKYIKFLYHKKRLDSLLEIVEAYFYLDNKNKDNISLEVFSAFTLKDQEIKMIRDYLSQLSQFKEKKIALVFKEDKSLIAGFKVFHESLVYDFSLSSMLYDLRKNICKN